MNLSIGFEPLISWTWILLVAVMVLTPAFAGVFLRQRGGVLRLAAAFALLAAIANPVLLDENRDPQKSVVAVVVDRSQSQDIGDRTNQTDAILKGVRDKLDRFPQFDIREIEAGAPANAGNREETRLFEALESVFRDVPPSRIAGSILITDGQVHDLPSEGAVPVGGPVHALITGSEGELDYRISFEKAPRFGIVGKTLEMTYRVSNNQKETGSARIRVSVNGELVNFVETKFDVETPLQIEIPRAGRNIIELTIPGMADEITTINNTAIALVDGIRENLRVLLVSGEPHAGERTWRNLLKSDASVDLVHFTILRPPEKQDGTPITDLSLIAFPTRELFVEKINDFDLIIFDRYQHRDVLPVLYYDHIAQYVARGGALLVAAGPEYAGSQSIAKTPLMAALPALPTGIVVDQAFYPRLTDMGERHPVTRGLDGSAIEPPRWSRWFRMVGIEQPLGTVVLKGAGERPLLLLNRHEQGRVGMLLSDQGWLWARGYEGGGPHVSLYRRIAHWLMKEPELEEERLSADGKGMNLEIRRQTMSEDPGEATIVSPSGASQDLKLVELEPGIFSAVLETSEIGLYQIANGELTTLAHVGPVDAPEFADATSTTTILKDAAEKSGGSVRRAAGTNGPSLPGIVPVRSTGEAAGRDWMGLRTTSDSILRSVNRVPLFAGFVGLGILLFALGSMWHREGR